ncbi:hypothetical protein AgCh_032170 [Apium graveolens]
MRTTNYKTWKLIKSIVGRVYEEQQQSMNHLSYLKRVYYLKEHVQTKLVKELPSYADPAFYYAHIEQILRKFKDKCRDDENKRKKEKRLSDKLAARNAAMKSNIPKLFISIRRKICIHGVTCPSTSNVIKLFRSEDDTESLGKDRGGVGHNFDSFEKLKKQIMKMPLFRHLKPEFEELRLSESYEGMRKHTGDRSNIPLGRFQLEDAIYTLCESNKIEDIARAMTISIEMISEVIRLRLMKEFVHLHFEGGKAPGALLTNLQNNWNTLSKQLLNWIKTHKDFTITVGHKEYTAKEVSHALLVAKPLKPTEFVKGFPGVRLGITLVAASAETHSIASGLCSYNNILQTSSDSDDPIEYDDKSNLTGTPNDIPPLENFIVPSLSNVIEHVVSQGLDDSQSAGIWITTKVSVFMVLSTCASIIVSQLTFLLQIFRYQYDISSPGVPSQLRITSTRDLNLNLTVSNAIANMRFQAYASWTNFSNVHESYKAREAVSSTLGETPIVDIHHKRNFCVKPQNKLVQDIFVRATEIRGLPNIIKMPSGEMKPLEVPV